MKCSNLRASDRDEEQGRTHSCRAAVEGLLAVFQSSDYHADALRAAQSTTAYKLPSFGDHKMYDCNIKPNLFLNEFGHLVILTKCESRETRSFMIFGSSSRSQPGEPNRRQAILENKR